MSDLSGKTRWGDPPWTIDFYHVSPEVPAEADYVVVGGGFSGLSAATWLRRLDPTKRVVLLEAAAIGTGASGRTGGMALAESAAGDLPGLGDVLANFSAILGELSIECDFALPGVWELGRKNGSRDSPISWSDSGDLRAVGSVPGGSIDPGKLVSGLARAARRAGVVVIEHAPVENAVFDEPVRLQVRGKELRAQHVVFATNAQSLELSGLAGRSEPMLTLALCTESLTSEQLGALGLLSRKPFYTVDFPYLWGRLLSDDAAIFGSGLVRVDNWRALAQLDVAAGETAALMARLEKRVRGLHPTLAHVGITHRWGGPILIGDDWVPVFSRHPQSERVIVLGAYSGHGVALSVYLGRWAAESLLRGRELPGWAAE